MQSVALIHTVKSVANTFEDKLRSYLTEEIEVHNLLDDFLANHSNKVGEFDINNHNRLFNDIKNCELTGADLIVTTCSTLTPAVDRIRPFISVPIIAIDDAMAKYAVKYGSKILVLATAQSAIEPTKNKLSTEAAKISVTLDLESTVCAEAFKALKALDLKTHDGLVLEHTDNFKGKGYDCVVLAQASMAHLDEGISKRLGIPVLSSPELCLEQVKKTLGELR